MSDFFSFSFVALFLCSFDICDFVQQKKIAQQFTLNVAISDSVEYMMTMRIQQVNSKLCGVCVVNLLNDMPINILYVLDVQIAMTISRCTRSVQAARAHCGEQKNRK